MDNLITKESNLLSGLFQQLVNDIKGGMPLWDDFINKTLKLNQSLKVSIIAISAFIDTFQKLADLATNGRGATREIGASLTRLCLRHQSIEKKLKEFTECLVSSLVAPLEEMKEEWVKSISQIEKEHSKEFKKAQQEIKRASSENLRLQKKIKKGRSELLQGQLESARQDIDDKRLLLVESERAAVRQVMIEQRSHFCQLVCHLKPVLDKEISLMEEAAHLQEIIYKLCQQSSEPAVLTEAGEQVLSDLKTGQITDIQIPQQSPPSSPVSMRSRKSSICSGNSGPGSSTNSSPTRLTQRSLSQILMPTALSTVSSHDSGFISQDTLAAGEAEVTQDSESLEMQTDSVYNRMSQTTRIGRQVDMRRLELLGRRGHTITAGVQATHQRAPLTADTFQPPSPLPSRHSISSESSESRIAAIKPPVAGPKPKARRVSTPMIPGLIASSPGPTSSAPVNPFTDPSQLPTYVNFAELVNMSVEKQRAVDRKAVGNLVHPISRMTSNENNTPVEEGKPPLAQRSTSVPAQTKSGTSKELAAAIRELEESTSALQVNCQSDEQKVNNDYLQDEDVDLSFLDEFPDVAAEMRQFFTLPRKKKAINRLHKGLSVTDIRHTSNAQWTLGDDSTELKKFKKDDTYSSKFEAVRSSPTHRGLSRPSSTFKDGGETNRPSSFYKAIDSGQPSPNETLSGNHRRTLSDSNMAASLWPTNQNVIHQSAIQSDNLDEAYDNSQDVFVSRSNQEDTNYPWHSDHSNMLRQSLDGNTHSDFIRQSSSLASVEQISPSVKNSYVSNQETCLSSRMNYRQTDSNRPSLSASQQSLGSYVSQQHILSGLQAANQSMFNQQAGSYIPTQRQASFPHAAVAQHYADSPSPITDKPWSAVIGAPWNRSSELRMTAQYSSRERSQPPSHHPSMSHYRDNKQAERSNNWQQSMNLPSSRRTMSDVNFEYNRQPVSQVNSEYAEPFAVISGGRRDGLTLHYTSGNATDTSDSNAATPVNDPTPTEMSLPPSYHDMPLPPPPEYLVDDMSNLDQHNDPYVAGHYESTNKYDEQASSHYAVSCVSQVSTSPVDQSSSTSSSSSSYFDARSYAKPQRF